MIIEPEKPFHPTYTTLNFDHSDDPGMQLLICLSEVMRKFSTAPGAFQITERDRQAAIDWFIARYRTP